MGTARQPVLPVLLIAALSLIIPLAIVLGHRHPTGALLLSGGGPLVAFSALWLVFDGSRLLDGTNSPLKGAPLAARSPVRSSLPWARSCCSRPGRLPSTPRLRRGVGSGSCCWSSLASSRSRP
jgi:hypothetical protein